MRPHILSLRSALSARTAPVRGGRELTTGCALSSTVFSPLSSRSLSFVLLCLLFRSVLVCLGLSLSLSLAALTLLSSCLSLLSLSLISSSTISLSNVGAGARRQRPLRLPGGGEAIDP